jgi:RimJ/RimL family protein N-acetyltransferase
VIVSTPRLDLHPVPLPMLQALLDGDVALADRLAPYAVTAETFEGDAYVLTLRRDQLSADPTELPWLYRAAVLRDTGQVVARAGFHAPPDADGTVEIGYRVAPAHRRRGIATELTGGLLAWAGQHGARRCLGSTSPDNLASQAVLARHGFVRTGEAMDDVDLAEAVQRGLHDAGTTLGGHHGVEVRDRLAALGRDLVDDLLRGGVVAALALDAATEVVDDDEGTAGRELEGVGAAEAAAGAGDDGHTAVEADVGHRSAPGQIGDGMTPIVPRRCESSFTAPARRPQRRLPSAGSRGRQAPPGRAPNAVDRRGTLGS